MPVCIHLDHLTRSYGPVVAVNNLTFDVKRGEIFGLLGPNGAGKSTTLSMMAGLLRPTEGALTVFGKDYAKDRLAIAGRIGVLTENPAFYDHLSVTKNLTLLARLSRKEVTIDRTLDLVGLLPYADQRAGNLSRGLRQRLGLGQAFLTEPELLLLDEPTSGLDPEQSMEIVELLRRLAEAASVTIVLSSHRMDEVESLCDRVAVLDRGRLVTCEKTDELLSYDRTQIDVLVDAPDAAARRLQQEPWVAEAHVYRGRVRVRLNEPNPHQLNTFLVGAGYQVVGLLPRRRTLQELYLKAKNQ